MLRTEFGFNDLDLLDHLEDLRGVLRILSSCFFRLRHLFLETVSVLVEEVDSMATAAPPAVQVDNLPHNPDQRPCWRTLLRLRR